MGLDPVNYIKSNQLPYSVWGISIIDLVKLLYKDMQFTELVNQMQLKRLDFQKIISRYIDIPGLTEVIFNTVVRHHILPNSIIYYESFVIILKFLFSLYYFFRIKQKLLTAFHP